MDDWLPDDPRRTPVVLRRDLIATGMDDRAIQRAVRAGGLVRVRHGSYVDSAAWRECDQLGRHAIETRAVLRRAQADVVVSHLSAAVLWGCPLFDTEPRQVHLTRRDQHAGRREAGVVQHLGELREQDVLTLHGAPVTSPTRTALDCATLLGGEQTVALMGDLLHRGLTTKDALRHGGAFMSRWPGTLRQRVHVDLADGRCESVGEHRTLYLCWRHGLPTPVPQWPVLDAAGRVLYRLDFAWPQHGVFLEFDGEVKYRGLLRTGEDATDVVLRERRREREIERLTGWTCVRLVWADLYRSDRTAATIRRALTQRPTATG